MGAGFIKDKDEETLVGRCRSTDCRMAGQAGGSPDVSGCRQSSYSSDSCASTVSRGPTSVFPCTSYSSLIDHDDMLSHAHRFGVVVPCGSCRQSRRVQACIMPGDFWLLNPSVPGNRFSERGFITANIYE